MRTRAGHGWTVALLALLLVAIGAFGVTGCGDENGTATTTPAAEGGEIPIGFLTSYTGELGAYGDMWFSAAMMAVDEINAAGGVLGKQIKLYTEDDQTNVEEGVRAARKLINVNNVVAIAGPTSPLFARGNQIVLIRRERLRRLASVRQCGSRIS